LQCVGLYYLCLPKQKNAVLIAVERLSFISMS
jgi:hypothetical protein